MNMQQQEMEPLVSPDGLIIIHGWICDEFGRLEGLRQSMLGYVPSFTIIFSSIGIFTGVATGKPMIQNFLVAIGFLGMFTTFALYFRETLLNRESYHLAEQRRIYQKKLRIPETMFFEESHSILTNSISTVLIYAASFTA